MAIPALPGGTADKTYKVGKTAYKVKSNSKNTVTFTKAKNAKSVVVPATVKIKGKRYKVVAVGAKAFASAKGKVASATVGKNASTIGKNAFAGCAKLKAVRGGAGVKAIGKAAFKGCKAMTKCAPLSSKKLARIGASAFSGAKKFAKATIASKKLKKAAVKGCFKGSKLSTVKVKVGVAKANKTYVKKYAKVFTAKYCGKRVVVK